MIVVSSLIEVVGHYQPLSHQLQQSQHKLEASSNSIQVATQQCPMPRSWVSEARENRKIRKTSDGITASEVVEGSNSHQDINQITVKILSLLQKEKNWKLDLNKIKEKLGFSQLNQCTESNEGLWGNTCTLSGNGKQRVADSNDIPNSQLPAAQGSYSIIGKQQLKGQKQQDSHRKQQYDHRIKKQRMDTKRAEKKQIRQIGFLNQANQNLCYINSVLRCLISLSHFTHSFKRVIKGRMGEHGCEQTKSLSLSFALYSIIKTEQSGKATALNSLEVKSIVSEKKPEFVGNGQKDAQQFLLNFFEILCQELNTPMQPMQKSSSASQQFWNECKLLEWSIVNQYFMGQIKNTVTCNACKHRREKFENILHLSVAVLSETVEEAIAQSFSAERLTYKDNNYRCENCEHHYPQNVTEGVFTKESEIVRLPKILIIHTQRIIYRGTPTRIRGTVKIKGKLDFRKLTAARHWSRSHKSFEYPVYEVNGMVNHIGSATNGHYMALSKSKNSRKWYFYDDNNVSNCPFKEDEYFQNPYSYLLFYVKKDRVGAD